MKLFILTFLCFFCLQTATATVLIHLYKNFKNSIFRFTVTAELDLEESPATITVTRTSRGTNDGDIADHKGLHKLLQEVIVLRPSSVPSSAYTYLRINVDGRDVCVTDIDRVDVGTDQRSLKIIWNKSAAFRVKEVPEKQQLRNYLMDIGDGGKVVGVTGRTTDFFPGPIDIIITEVQANEFGTTLHEIRSRLENVEEVHIGGPCIQIVDHRLLQWTVLSDIKQSSNDCSDQYLCGVSSNRKQYWIKKFGEEEVLGKGTLESAHNDTMEFRITGNVSPVLLIQIIRNTLQCVSTEKISQRYMSGLCLSVSEKRSTVEGAIAIADRMLFGVTKVELDPTSKDIVVISFDWLETANGSSYLHAIKLGSSGAVFFTASIYFPKGKINGVAVVQENEQHKDNRNETLETVRENLLKEMKGGACTVEATGPLRKAVEYNGNYKTPFSFTVAKITDLGPFSFEIHFRVD